MSKCVDCGSELNGEDRYCKVCGSPTLVVPPTERDLRDMSRHDPDRFNPHRRTKIILITIILLIMFLFAYFISKMVGQLGSVGGRFY
jgi:uncharacterized membrane protein YvbJ